MRSAWQGLRRVAAPRALISWLAAHDRMARVLDGISEHRLRRLLAARELLGSATKMADTADPLEPASLFAVTSLARDAALWALLADHEGSMDADALVTKREPDPGVDAVTLDILARGVPAIGEAHPDMLPMVASQLLALANHLIRERAEPLNRWDAWRRARARRLWLCWLAIAALVGVFAVTIRSIAHRRDLAEGKPWTTSSMIADCKPSLHECGGVVSEIFFHTNTEDSPWIRYDLGASTQVSEVFVRNRSDFGLDRAVPLVVELSDDGESFREVARRKDVFDEWTAQFKGQRARYVRLLVPRRTALHLEKVEIR